MKKKLNVFSVLVIATFFSGCATSEKVAHLEMNALPAKVHHGDESSDGYYQLGQYLQQKRRYVEAANAYNQSLKLDINNLKAGVALSVLYAKEGKYQKSIEQLKMLVERFPSDGDIYNNLGYVYYLSGDYSNSVSVLDKAIALNSKNKRALNNMALVLNKQGKSVESKKYVDLVYGLEVQKVASDNRIQPNTVNVSDLGVNKQQVSVDGSPNNVNQKVVVDDFINQHSASLKVQKISSGIYEIVKSEALNKELVASDSKIQASLMPRMVAQSGGVSFTVHPLVNKLFNENVTDVASIHDLNNKKFKIEVVNGNGVTGFARKTKETLVQLGFIQAQQVTNQMPYRQSTTVIQYRDGYKSEAIVLGRTFKEMPTLVKLNATHVRSDLRLVLGRDVINSKYS